VAGHRCEDVLYKVFYGLTAAPLDQVVGDIFNHLLKVNLSECGRNLFDRKSIATERLPLKTEFGQCTNV
jgi:hypothetical protein